MDSPRRRRIDDPVTRGDGLLNARGLLHPDRNTDQLKPLIIRSRPAEDDSSPEALEDALDHFEDINVVPIE